MEIKQGCVRKIYCTGRCKGIVEHNLEYVEVELKSKHIVAYTFRSTCSECGTKSTIVLPKNDAEALIANHYYND